MVGGRNVSSESLYEEGGIVPVPPLCLLHGKCLKVSDLVGVVVPGVCSKVEGHGLPAAYVLHAHNSVGKDEVKCIPVTEVPVEDTESSIVTCEVG